MAVLVTARPPADPVATARALGDSARAGLPWLVVTTSPDVDDRAFRPAVDEAPDAVGVVEVTDLLEGPDSLFIAIVDACAAAMRSAIRSAYSAGMRIPKARTRASIVSSVQCSPCGVCWEVGVAPAESIELALGNGLRPVSNSQSMTPRE